MEKWRRRSLAAAELRSEAAELRDNARVARILGGAGLAVSGFFGLLTIETGLPAENGPLALVAGVIVLFAVGGGLGLRESVIWDGQATAVEAVELQRKAAEPLVDAIEETVSILDTMTDPQRGMEIRGILDLDGRGYL